MPRIDLDILNQKQTPAFYASSLATRPAFGFVGRIFVDTDSPSTGLYRDTGTAWIQIADPGAGTTGTLQQVTTNGSSTTVGISTSGNGIGIGTTIPVSNRLDIHSGTGLQATFNGTGVTNAAIQLQLAGVGKWTLQNNYNAANNDFVITDVLNASNRITVTNQGQTFIGANTTSSGLLVVNNASSDSHIVVLGANSPSIRIRDSGSSLVQNVGLGISTGTNAFIQGSASGNYCIFNSSSTASPILFGVYDAGTSNTQEAVRISAARNFLIGTVIDTGYKLLVSGTANISGATLINSSLTAGILIVNSSGLTSSPNSLIINNNGSSVSNFYSFGTNITTLGGFKFIGIHSDQGSPTTFLDIAINTGIATFNNSISVVGINTTGNILMGYNNALRFGGSPYRYSIYRDSSGALNTYFDDEYDNAGSSVIFRMRTTGTPINVLTLTGSGTSTFSGNINIGNSVAAAIAAPSTHKVSILIGGIQYYLLASNV